MLCNGTEAVAPRWYSHLVCKSYSTFKRPKCDVTQLITCVLNFTPRQELFMISQGGTKWPGQSGALCYGLTTSGWYMGTKQFLPDLLIKTDKEPFNCPPAHPAIRWVDILFHLPMNQYPCLHDGIWQGDTSPGENQAWLSNPRAVPVPNLCTRPDSSKANIPSNNSSDVKRKTCHRMRWGSATRRGYATKQPEGKIQLVFNRTGW